MSQTAGRTVARGSTAVNTGHSVPARPRWGAGREFRNLSRIQLIEQAIRRREGELSSTGALAVETGRFTGRSPDDKYVVRHGALADEIWWGKVNQPLGPDAFSRLHSDVLEHLNRGDRFRQDLSAGSDPEYRVSVRLISESAWSTLFASNLFLPPADDDMPSADGWTILHAPRFEADPKRHGTSSPTAVAIDFEWRRVIIVGTRYAGEIKKSIFTVLQGILPALGVATMHCAANEGPRGDSALFFGLSGTGKTTLSTDPGRRLIGDDEHGWADRGIFNFEGGSYAKTIGLSAASEPEIFEAARKFGTVLENVVLDPITREPRFDDGSLTENTRAAYPLASLDETAGGCGGHPLTILFLSADAFGVLPPLAKLTRDQALYWYLTGYTSKLAGTERGITSPTATFSACFGSPFLPLPPMRYADLFGERLNHHGSNVWLVNTGWSGGPYGVGERMPIGLTRTLIAAALDGTLVEAEMQRDRRFGFLVPGAVAGVPAQGLRPRETWSDHAKFDELAATLARDMAQNFARFGDVQASVRAAGPVTS